MTVIERVIEVVRRVVEPSRREQVHAGALLFEEKLLDSFGVINLVGELEAEFGIAVPTEELTVVNFGVVEDIAVLVERSLAARA